MYCPNCKQEFEGKFCPECGTKLIEKPAGGFNLNLGDANAISGGVNMSDSHNVHNEDRSVHNISNISTVTHNITQVAAQKTEIEILQERKKQYLNACNRAYEDNVLDPEEKNYLDRLRMELGLDEATANSILESVRIVAEKNGRKTTLNPLAKTKLKILSDNLQNNNVDALRSQIDGLDVFVSKYTHDELSRKYYLVLAALKPKKCISLHENNHEDSYWRSFWSYIAYLKLGNTAKADEIIASMDKFADYPEDNITVLAVAGALINGNTDEANEYISAVTGEYSPTLQRLVDSLYLILDPTMAAELGASEETSAFYLVNVFGQEDPQERARKEAEAKEKVAEEAREKEEAQRKAEEEVRAFFEAERKRKEEEERLEFARIQQEREAQRNSVKKAKPGVHYCKTIGIDLRSESCVVSVFADDAPVFLGSFTKADLKAGNTSSEDVEIKMLKHAAGVAKTFFSTTDDIEAVVTCPTDYYLTDLISLQKKIQEAGLVAKRIVPTASAAALAYAFHNIDDDFNLAIATIEESGKYDFACAESSMGILEMLNTCGVTNPSTDYSTCYRDTLIKTFEASELTKSDVDKVIIDGASKHLDLLKKAMQECLGQIPVIVSENLAAQGVAIQAAILDGEFDIDLLLQDVTQPHNIGIEVAGGEMHTIIKANSTIPCKKSIVFSTNVDNQTVVTVNVLEGNAQKAKDNKSQGVFYFSGIAPAKKGEQQIIIEFDIEANRMLRVSARNKTTGEYLQTSSEAPSTTPEEKEEMKFYLVRIGVNQQKYYRIDTVPSIDAVKEYFEEELEEADVDELTCDNIIEVLGCMGSESFGNEFASNVGHVLDSIESVGLIPGTSEKEWTETSIHEDDETFSQDEVVFNPNSLDIPADGILITGPQPMCRLYYALRLQDGERFEPGRLVISGCDDGDMLHAEYNGKTLECMGMGRGDEDLDYYDEEMVYFKGELAI